MALYRFLLPVASAWLVLGGLVLGGLAPGGCTKEENKPAAGRASPASETQPATAVAELRTMSMRIGSGTFKLEIAANAHDREQGLMYRESMPLDHGMIFVFGTDQERAFWMKNTWIPLDIVYVNSAGTVVSIQHGEPLREEPTIPSEAPMKWAIELNDGVAAAAGLKIGDKLIVPAEAREPAPN